MWHLTVEDVGLWLWHLNFFLYLLILFGIGFILAVIEDISRS